MARLLEIHALPVIFFSPRPYMKEVTHLIYYVKFKFLGIRFVFQASPSKTKTTTTPWQIKFDLYY